MPPNLGGFFMVRSYYPSECHADYFDFERIEALKPAIEACGISTLSQSPMLGFHKQMDNRIKLLEEILSFRMQGVEFDNGDMYVDGHKAASDVRDEFVSVTEKLMDELAQCYNVLPQLDINNTIDHRPEGDEKWFLENEKTVHIKFNLTIPLQQLNGLETLVIIMVANKYAFLQITRRRFLNEWEAFKKVISRRNIRRRITIPLTLSNLKLHRRINRTTNNLQRHITRSMFMNEWEAFKKIISRRKIRRRITIPLTLSNLKLLRRITRTENILHRNFTRRQVAIQNRVASNIGISQSTFSVKVLNLFSRSRRKTNKRKSKHSAILRNKETRHRMFIGLLNTTRKLA